MRRASLGINDIFGKRGTDNEVSVSKSYQNVNSKIISLDKELKTNPNDFNILSKNEYDFSNTNENIEYSISNIMNKRRASFDIDINSMSKNVRS